MRNDIVKIVNAISEDYSNKSREINGVSSLDFDLMKCYNLILDYCKVSNTRPRQNEYKQENGQLYINSKSIGRVGALIVKPAYMNCPAISGIDYEAKILAKQENEF